jgi:hypothetical protein
MELTDFIICEDIRREITGKAILIGVYDDAIKILKTPKTDEGHCAHLRLAFMARIASSAESNEPLPTRFEFDIIARPQGQILAKIAGSMNLKIPVRRISIAGQLPSLQVDYTVNELTIELRLFNNESQMGMFNAFPIAIEFISQLPSF